MNTRLMIVSPDLALSRSCITPPDPAIALLFSGEEQYGKYLDLYANHAAYNNLKHITKRLGYLQYLDVLLAAQSTTVHNELPKECRTTRDYELCVISPLFSKTSFTSFSPGTSKRCIHTYCPSLSVPSR